MTTLSNANASRRDTTALDEESSRFSYARWLLESALLIVLAIVCIALEDLALAPKSVDHQQFASGLLTFAIEIGLMVPFALSVNPWLGLPGAPLIAATIEGERVRFRIRSLFKISVGYAFLALMVGGAVLAIVFLPLILAHPKMQLPVRSFMKLPPGRLAIIGTLVSIAAGVGEEIQFRLVSFAVFAWIASLFTSGSSGPSSRGALWFATIMQAYAFGLFHRGPANDLLRLLGWSHSAIPLLVSGLLVPQTSIGIVLGRLYLRRGLEASMLAHAMIDATLFVMLALIRSLLKTG